MSARSRVLEAIEYGSCGKCGAAAGDPCRTPNDRVTEIHARHRANLRAQEPWRPDPDERDQGDPPMPWPGPLTHGAAP